MFYDASFLPCLLNLCKQHPILGDPTILQRGHLPTVASAKDNGEKNVKESGRTMCFNAKELSLNHPVTGEWVSFSAAPSF